MTDRDALALEYTRRNAEANEIDQVAVYGSLGYEGVPDSDFDLIISNVPAKAGEAAIAEFLLGARRHLTPDGMVAVVVVDRLHEMVSRVLPGSPGVEVTYQKARSTHSVFHYRFTGDVGADTPERQDDPYYRAAEQFSYGKARAQMRVAFGMPEFDTLSYQSRLLVEGLQSVAGLDVRKAAVFNPGQGHIAVAVLKIFKPDAVAIFDRDLLSLKYTNSNLALNGLPGDRMTATHGLEMPAQGSAGTFDMVAGPLREDEGAEAALAHARQAAMLLNPTGLLLVAGGSTEITRLRDALHSKEQPLRLVERQRDKGVSLLIMKLKETGGER